MENKDKLSAEIQLLSIAVTLIISSCAGIGFITSNSEFSTNVLSQCFLVVIGITAVISVIWAVNTYLKINNLKK